MSLTAADVFPPDALDANRRGELSDAQRRGFGNVARDRRKSQLQFAAIALALAVLIGGFASSSVSIFSRGLVTLVCLGIAAVLVIRSVTGADALTRDLRDTHVKSAEGAIGKHRHNAGRNATNYFLDVGEQRFIVAHATYEFAPTAGFVRVYYLTRSRKIVNLEQLPNPAFEHATPQDIIRDATAGNVLRTLGAAMSFDPRKANEARANLAAMGNVLGASSAARPVPPAGAHDARPLGEAIVGRWSNGLMTVTFSPDGHVMAEMMGRNQQGHWSVDGSGHLRADVMGQAQVADAWIAGDRLTIVADGQGLTFTRQA
jgi:hypothetical protein